MATLDEAVRILPEATWWIKADGVDVVSGLRESVNLKWRGDADLNDGSVQKMHAAYLNRLDFISKIGLGDRRGYFQLQQDLTNLESELTDDLTFLSSGI